MKLIIFNIENHKYYNGMEDSGTNEFDKFYQEKKSNNPEIYNFQDYNGYCYGYASLSDGVVNLSELRESTDNSLLFDNNKETLTVFVSKDELDTDTYFIVGWYKNSDVFNLLQKKISYPSIGRDLYYNVRAKSSDCYLIPKDKRNFNFNINFKSNKNFYIPDHQSNQLNQLTTNNIKSQIIEYIADYTKNINIFDNIVLTDDLLNSTIQDAPENPMLLFKRGHIYLYNESNFIEAIKYFNTVLQFKDLLIKEAGEKAIIDIHYFKAIAFQNIHDFKNTKKEFEIVLEYAKYDLTILKTLVYLNMALENFEDAVNNCSQIIIEEAHDDSGKIFLEEIKCLKSECLIKINRTNEARELLKSVINETDIDAIKNHCNNILSIIS